MVAFAHFGLALLAYFGLLQFTIPSEFRFLEYAADNGMWGWIHVLCGLFLIAAVFRSRLDRQALSASAGFLFGWSFFNLLWGLSTIDPKGVSLAGPLLGFILASGAYLMAIAPLPTNVRECHHHGRD